MEKYIPYAKLSKKEKRKIDASKRSMWEMSPVTRRPENSKAYNRKKALRKDQFFDSPFEVPSYYSSV